MRFPLALMACSGFEAASSVTVDGGLDAGTPDVPIADAAVPDSAAPAAAIADADVPDVDAAVPEPCDTVFVAPGNGDDTRSGCDQTAPMKTLAKAITQAKARNAKEIRACAGVFDEPLLSLNVPISLRGGYDCQTWQRPAGFGYPNLGGSTETKVRRTDAASIGPVTLLVEGAAITRDTHIEGLSFDGPNEGARGVALAIRGKASPSVHEVIARGGTTAGTNDGAGSIGILVEGGSSPEIHHSTIGGGLGTADVNTGHLGAIAIQVLASNPFIHDCSIDASSSAVRSIGIHTSGGSKLSGANALKNVTITFAAADTASWGIGVFGPNDELDISDSSVQMRPMGCSIATKVCGARGISIQGSSKAIITRNRIAGGEVAATATTNSNITGVNVAFSEATIVNNQIWAGNEAAVATIGSIGIQGNDASLFVAHNTIVTGAAGGSYGLYLQGGTKVVLQRNLVGSASASPIGSAIVLRSCSGASIPVFDGNAFFGLAYLLSDQQTTTTACDSSLNSTNVIELGTNYSSAKGSVAAPAGIIAGGATRQTLFTTGWRLTAQTPCSVTQGTPAVLSVTSDGFGTARTAKTSTGAHENDAVTCP